MKRSGFLVVLALVAILAVNAIGAYNKMVVLEQSVDAAWAQVNTQLQRRYDLIPNLVNTVKGYAAHEQEAIQAVTEARAAMLGAQSPTEQQQAAASLENALGRLLVVVENYPELKADTVFVGLMDELAGTENRIAQHRMLFNDEVKTYNTYIARFPNVLWAKLFGRSARVYFEIPDAAQVAPQVGF
ncbi:MAG TPA: LemA family protein [Firmicutes bacterium]|jgi:LemA protein|nr:LemA family protein [Bacillota bacterium]